MNHSDINLSKSLCWLLRHGATGEGLLFDDGGFLDVEQILKLKQFKHYSEADVKRVVETNEKKRFTFRHKKSDNVLQIRANQGHSLKLDETGLLATLTKDTLPSPVYHGTYFRNLQSIKTDGLSRMSRNHIHFIPKFPGESGVVSGMRQNCEIFIVIDSLKALMEGYKFFESDNGVILCPGNEYGKLSPCYIREIWQLSPLKKLF